MSHPANGSFGFGTKRAPARPEPEPAAAISTGPDTSVEAIYDEAGIEVQAAGQIDGYTILKVGRMAGSQHLSGMPPENRRQAVLMALQAVGVDVSAVIADAIARQRALMDHEDQMIAELRAFESDKGQEIASLQAELDRLTSDYKLRIQASKDEVSRRQATLHNWQKQRRQESQRMADTASLLVPADSPAGGETLAALLDRSTTTRNNNQR